MIIVENGTIWKGTPDDEPAERTIIIEDRVISQVLAAGEAPDTPSEARRIDASGKFILPGLINSHTHICFNQDPGTPTDPMVAALEEARGDRDSKMATLTAEGQVEVASAVIDQDGRGFIDATTLPPLPDGKTYQLWGVVVEGDAISLGIFGPNPEIETFTVESEVAVLALTIEDAPGVISDGNQDGWYVGEVT